MEVVRRLGGDRAVGRDRRQRQRQRQRHHHQRILGVALRVSTIRHYHYYPHRGNIS